MVDASAEAQRLASRWLPAGVRRLIAGRSGPVLVALVLALVSLPLTWLAILGSSPENPLDAQTAFTAGLSAVIGGALVGGYVGGRVRRGHELTGAVVAFWLGWAAAVVAFPILPTLLGHTFQFGQFCIDSCSPLIDTSGESVPQAVVRMVDQYGSSVVVGSAFGGLVALPTLIVAIFLGRRSGVTGRRVAAVMAVAAFGIANMFSVQTIPGAFAILFVGVVAWSLILPPTHVNPTPP